MKHVYFLVVCIFFVGCNNDDDNHPVCDDVVIVDQAQYDSVDQYASISSISIDGNCLTLTYSESGCDGSTWVESLYDSSVIAESTPNQRYLKLYINNQEICLAVITKEKSFDISELQINNTNQVLLNLPGWSEPIVYNY